MEPLANPKGLEALLRRDFERCGQQTASFDVEETLLTHFSWLVREARVCLRVVEF